MKNVLVTLTDYLPSASGTEKSVIEYILLSPETAVHETIKELSEHTYASQSTIVRLCNKLGFNGYRDFKQIFSSELEIIRYSKYKDVPPITAADSVDEIASKVILSSIKALQNTLNLMETNIMNACIDLLEKARTVGLFGIGAGLVVARDAYIKMLRINKPCVFNDDWHNQRLQAQNLDSNDLAIVISYSGMTQEVLKCTEILKKNECPIITVTGNKYSPIAKLSTYCLLVSSDEQELRNGATASRIAQLGMIDVLYSIYSYRMYGPLMKRLAETYIRKQQD